MFGADEGYYEKIGTRDVFRARFQKIITILITK